MKLDPVKIRYFIITFGVVLLVNLVSWGLGEVVLLADLRQLEETRARDQYARLRAAFVREEEYLLRWAAVRALRLSETAGDESQIRKNLTGQLLEAADIDLLAVVSGKGDTSGLLTVTAEFNEQESLGGDELTRLFKPMVSELVDAGTPSGFVAFPGYLALIAIVPMDGLPTQQGRVIAVRLMDADTLEVLKNHLQLDFKISKFIPRPGLAGDSIDELEETVSLENGEELIVTGFLPSLASGGKLRMSLNLPRDVYPKALSAVRYYQSWIGVASLACGLLIWPLMIRLRSGKKQEQLLNNKLQERTQALIATSERYLQLFNQVPLPLWLVDLETLRYLDVNNAAIESYGYTREEFLAMTLLDLRPEEDAEKLLQTLSEVKRGLQNAGVWRHRRKDGTLIDVQIILRDLEHGRHLSRLVMAIDVTEQKQLQQDAERISRLAALGELAAGVAHEINNPNGMILRNLDFIGAVIDDALPLLAEQAGADELQLGGLDYSQVCEQAPQLLDDMQRGAGHIRDIVREMKHFSLFEEQPSMEPFDLTATVAAAVRLLDGPLRKATDYFDVEISADLPQCRGNLRQIEQVLINLLMNACQSLPDRTHSILLRTRFDPVKKSNLVEVIDKGKGISKDDLVRLTDPFFTTRRAQGGTGLGLSVSSRIVKQHGGTLNFKSTLGQGTHVTLALPVI